MLLKLHLYLVVSVGWGFFAKAENPLPLKFGAAANDTILPINDDLSIGPFNLSLPMLFYDENVTQAYLNNNGDITFDSFYSEYDPSLIPSTRVPPMIAIYWTDIDTRNGGADQNIVSARTSQSNEELLIAKSIIAGAGGVSFVPEALFVATWKEVEAYSLRIGNRNTFQLIVAYDSKQTWAIFAYRRLEFFATGTSVNTVIGFNDRQGLLGSLISNVNTSSTMNALLNETNCGLAGTFAFKISSVITLTGCGLLSQTTSITPTFGPTVGGTVVRFTNLPTCLEDPTVEIYCRFNGAVVNETRKGIRVSRSSVECLSPVSLVEGSADVSYAIYTPGALLFDPSNATWVTSSQKFQFSGDRPSVIRSDSNLNQILNQNETFGIQWNNTRLIESAMRSLNSVDGQVFNATEIQISVQFLAYSSASIENFLLISETQLGNYTNDNATITVPSNIIDFYVLNEMGTKWAPVMIRVVASLNNKRIGATYTSALMVVIPGGFRRLDFVSNDEERRLQALCSALLKPKSKCPNQLMDLPPCPRDARQAIADNSFQNDLNCRFPNGNCDYYHPGAAGCFRKNGPSGSGQQCCYSNTNGLITDPYLGGGTADCTAGDGTLFNSIFHILYDVVPYIACCKLSNQCDDYYRERPTDDGAKYVPPAPPGRINGDPHLRTIDGIYYDFNGFGEYVAFCGSNPQFDFNQLRAACDPSIPRLVGRNVTSVHMRFAQLLSTDKGTVTVGLGIEDPFHNEGRSAIAIVPHPTRRIDVFDGDTLVQFPEALSYQDLVTVNFESGMKIVRSANFSMNEISISIFTTTGIVIEIKEIGGVMMPTIDIPKINDTGIGLLGFVNNNSSDDFIASNGTLINTNVNLTKAALDELLFDHFGQSWMIRNGDASLFKALQSSTQSFTNYYNPTYRPAFEAPAIPTNLQSAADAACGSITSNIVRESCYYDIAMTGNVNLFGSVAQSVVVADETVKVLQNNAPIYNGSTTQDVTIYQGNTISLNLTVTDADGDNITFAIVTNEGNNFKLVPTSGVNGQTSLQFIGTNTTGQYVGQVTASDGVATTLYSVKVKVEIPPNNPPIFVGSTNTNVTIYRRAKASFNLTVTDPDNNNILTFAIVTNDGSKFQLVPTNGTVGKATLVFVGADIPGQYVGSVFASDGLVNTTTPFTVNVTVTAIPKKPCTKKCKYGGIFNGYRIHIFSNTTGRCTPKCFRNSKVPGKILGGWECGSCPKN